MAVVDADVELDVDALNEWIGDRLPAASEPLTAERMGTVTGQANALFFIRRGEHEWVLRRPPLVKNHPTASDTAREWRILNALVGTPVPHPTPRLYNDDAEVLGAQFMIMDRVDGFTPGGGLPEPFASDARGQWDLAMAYVDGLIELSKVDWVGAGLEGLGRPDGFLERQVHRWRSQLDGYRVRSLPEENFLCDWLDRNRPEMSPAAILHGDYSPFNVMAAPDLPGRLAAIIDWDTGTIGDPLLDIGHLLARWNEPGETPALRAIADDTAADIGRNHPTRVQMAERYAEGTGRDLANLAYYEVLALFKLGVILEGTYARANRAGVPDHDNPMGPNVEDLFRCAAAFARGERV